MTRGLAIAISVSATSLRAAGEPPRAWTWDPPTGIAASDPAFVPLVRVFVSPETSGSAAADMVCDRIGALGLGAGRIGIVINNWGRDTLVGNPGDRVASPPAPPSIDRGSPWTAHGRTLMSAWMDAFVARYQGRQAEGGTPSPDRWHLDCELRLPALRYLPDVSDCWGTAPLGLFAAMQSDPRWDTEPVLFAPGGIPSPQTVAAHWKSHGAPSFDAALARDHPANRSWSSWWDGMTREAVEGALHETFFSKVRNAWPATRSSEFAESLRMDGGIDPDGTARAYADFEWWDRGWMRSAWNGRAELQAPALYLFGSTFLGPAEGFWEGNMRLHRANLDACLHSYGGVPPSEVTPWVTLPRVPLPAGPGVPDRAVGDEEFLQLVALLRGRGIDEFMLWPGGDGQLWEAAQRGIHAAWDCEITAATVEAGSADGSPLAQVRRADRRTLRVVPGPSGSELRLRFATPPISASRGPGKLWIASELAGPGEVTIEARDRSGGWRWLSTDACGATLPGARWIGPLAADGIVAGDGSLELRVRTGAAVGPVDIDLVQVARLPMPPAVPGDLDGNGRVDGADLSVLLGSWGATGGTGDLNADGTVNGADLALLLGWWTAG